MNFGEVVEFADQILENARAKSTLDIYKRANANFIAWLKSFKSQSSEVLYRHVVVVRDNKEAVDVTQLTPDIIKRYFTWFGIKKATFDDANLVTASATVATDSSSAAAATSLPNEPETSSAATNEAAVASEGGSNIGDGANMNNGVEILSAINAHKLKTPSTIRNVRSSIVYLFSLQHKKVPEELDKVVSCFLSQLFVL
jgi:hypothetical protein